MKTVITGRGWGGGGGVIMRKSLTAFGTQGEAVVLIQDIKPVMSGTLWSSHAVSLLLGEAVVALQKTESADI